MKYSEEDKNEGKTKMKKKRTRIKREKKIGKYERTKKSNRVRDNFEMNNILYLFDVCDLDPR